MTWEEEIEALKKKQAEREAYNKTLPGYIEQVQKRAAEATPGPWGPYPANIPFCATVTKPAPSSSKHDYRISEYWRIEDAVFIANAQQDVTRLISILKLFSDYLSPYLQDDPKLKEKFERDLQSFLENI